MILFKHCKILLLIIAMLIANYFTHKYDLPLLIILNIASIIIVIITSKQLQNIKVSSTTLLMLAALGVCYAYLSGYELIGVLALPFFNLFIGFGIMFIFKLFKKEILQQEELKILFISGLFLTVENIDVFYLMICFFVVAIALYFKRCKHEIYYYFGASVSISLYLCALFGKNMSITFLAL